MIGIFSAFLTGPLVGMLMATTASPSAYAGDTLHLRSGSLSVDDSMKNFEWERDRRRRKDLLRGDKKNHLFIVQFRSAITETDRQDLATLNARILGYVPDDAYVVEATGVVAQTIRLSSTRVRDVLKFESQWKIDPDLADALSDLDGARHDGAEKVDALKVQVQMCASETVEVSIHSIAQLEKLAAREQTLWIRPVAESEESGGDDNVATDQKMQPKIVGRAAASADASAALAADESPTGDGLSIGNPKGIAFAETDSYPLSIRRHGHVRVELDYKDAKPAACADTETVNELSVTVKDLKGDEHRAVGPHAVLEFTGSRGSYDISVRGENVPSGRQPYTLHVSVD